MKLAIISHTEHYKTNDGIIVGWSPTVNEINHLLDLFDEIFHVAMFHDDMPPPSVLPYISDKISFIPIPAVGGKTVKSKLKTLWCAPKIIRTVSKILKQVDYFQLRTPTGISVFLIPYLTFFSRKRGWYKYAGNWNQEHPPLGYGLQRWMLKHQNRKVTINGTWNNQPKHCLTFENPCLTLEDLEIGQQVIQNKTIEGKLIFCFVGRLEHDKGVARIIKAFKSLSIKEKYRIDSVHLVGNGTDMDYFKNLSKNCDVNFEFHGFLSRKAVFEIYKKAHVFLLPTTASEGFPKVIAEAMNFGCIPIVSNISSISQYICHKKNGFLLNEITVGSLMEYITLILNLNNKEYCKFVKLNRLFKFTYKNYNHSILSEIIH